MVACPVCGGAEGLLLRWTPGQEQAHTISCRQRHEWTDPRISPLALRQFSQEGPPPTARGPWRTEVGNPVRVRGGRWPRRRTIACPACQGREGIVAERDRGTTTLECECMHRWPHPLGDGLDAWMDLELDSPAERRALWWGTVPLLATAAGIGYWWASGAPWALLAGAAWAAAAALRWVLLRRSPRVDVRAELGQLLRSVVQWPTPLLVFAATGAGVAVGGHAWGFWLMAPTMLLTLPWRPKRRRRANA